MPLYQSANGKIRQADEWGLFFWSIPVLAVIFVLPNRWLKILLYVLSAIGGLVVLFLLTFLATFKSTPLIGFSVAKVSIVTLIVCWFALGIISLLTLVNKRVSSP